MAIKLTKVTEDNSNYETLLKTHLGKLSENSLKLEPDVLMIVGCKDEDLFYSLLGTTDSPNTVVGLLARLQYYIIQSSQEDEGD